LCVDSDYDYLSDGATETSKIIKENPFIFQTYTYSVENYKCFSDSLHQIVVSATLNDNPIFDYKAFIEKYSEITYDLFLYSFFYERKYQQEIELHQKEYKVKVQSLDEKSLKEWQADNQPKKIFPIVEGFCKCIQIPPQKVNISDQGTQALSVLEKEVNNKLKSLPKINEEVLENLKKELSKLGLSPKNTYLFIKGHTIYDNVVMRFLRPIGEDLKDQKKKEIVNNATTKKERDNRLNQYQNNIQHIETTLKNNKNYQDSFLMSKIESDINNYLLPNPLA